MKRIISATIALLLFVSLFGCTRKVDNSENVRNLYFANLDMNDLVVEERSVEAKSLDDIAEKVVKELLKGPKSNSYKAVIPEKTRLLSIDIDNAVASVNFNKEYFSYGDKADTVELLARYSIINTLCDIDGIDKVKIFIDGVELTNASGVPVGALGKEDILLTATPNAKEETLLLYFPDSQAMYLNGEKRTVPVVDNSIEKTIVLELVKGPESEGLTSTIPADTKVISAETKDGICFVNLSPTFVEKHSAGSTAEAFSIFSIVNSLTELDNVNSVQFLIEGQKIDGLKHMLLDEPYTRNEEYLK